MESIGSEIDNESGVPIWVQLYQRLTFLISTGQCKPGDRLPTVRELATELNVNYHTINKAYHELEQNGFIEMKVGKGSYVKSSVPTQDADGYKNAMPLVQSIVEELMQAGMSPTDIIHCIGDYLGLSVVILNPRRKSSLQTKANDGEQEFRHVG